MDVGAHGHDLAVDILERQLAGAQAAVGAIVDAAIGHLQDAVLARHNARAAKDGDAQSRGRGGAERDNLVERDLGREPKRTGSALGKCLHAGRVMHRQARANLGRGAGMSGYGELGDIADGDGGSGIDPRIDALVVDGAADLVEYGYDALLKCIGGGELGRIERVGGHVDARYTLGASGLGGLERGDGGADLRLIAVVLGRGAGITGYNRRQLERFRALLVRCQNGLFQRLTSGGAHLVHGGKAHTAAGVERNVKACGLKGRGAHAPDVLNQIGRPYTEKIAVIGAGPAGMSCAYYLANKGYPVTVFDRNPVPGGMLTLGIPSFRLEKDVLNAEIDILREMGVEFQCGVEVGRDITIEQLRAQGYKGFYVAIGAQKSAKLRIPGEELDGVYGGVDFLRAVNLGHETHIGKRCAVIGGGNVAMDVCRSAVRLGADETYVLYRRSEAELPADPEEVKEAMEEGVQFRFLTAPVEILGTDGKVTGIRVERMVLGEPDEKGRRKPVGTGEFETLAVDSVIGAIGQTVDWGTLDTGALTTTKKGTAEADALTYQTAQPDIFVGGDCYTGPKFAIDAIAAGKEAAISLHRYVHPGQTLTAGRDRRVYKALDKEHVLIETADFDKDHRQIPGYNAAKAKTFSDARVTFTEEQVRRECARCLGCGATKVDSYLCIGCGLCTTKCKFDAIHLKKVRDWHAGSYETMPIKVAEGVVKRAGSIVKKAVSK